MHAYTLQLFAANLKMYTFDSKLINKDHGLSIILTVNYLY